jgi:hypothetical protein
MSTPTSTSSSEESDIDIGVRGGREESNCLSHVSLVEDWGVAQNCVGKQGQPAG